MYKGDNFGLEEKYKLYRSIHEILHPTISKSNISSYRIVLDSSCLPVRVYYPSKLANINSVIIYIPGNGKVTNCFTKYDEILSEMALKTDKLVIAVDYFDEEIKYPSLFNKCYDSVDYIIKHLELNGIDISNLYITGDSFGGNLASTITVKRINENKDVNYSEILFYPLLSGEYFGKTKFSSLQKDDKVSLEDLEIFRKQIKKYISNQKRLKDKYVSPLKEKDFTKYPRTLIISGDLDIVRDEDLCFYNMINVNGKSDYYNILFERHGFLDFDNDDVKCCVYNKLTDFMNNY